MRLATITAATALSLATVSIPTVGIADWRGDQFGHRHFHNHKTLVLPYADYDYEYPTDALGDYPPPSVVPPRSPPSVCQRNEETFTVPSEGGGTRKITIINCP